MSCTCFCTVGSTRFDLLSNTILSDGCISALRAVGINRLVLQIGAAEFDRAIFEKVFGGSSDRDTGVVNNYKGIKIEFFRYKSTIQANMAEAKLVIGHAGAGTVLECMRLRKPLIVVVNEALADNHQVELAAKLASLGHLLYCIPSQLEDRLRDAHLFSLTPFVPPDMSKVARYIDKAMGVPT